MRHERYERYEESFQKIRKGRRDDVERSRYSAKDRWSMCGKKNRYPSEHLAIRYMEKASDERGDELRPYYCPICNGWHITSKSPWKKLNQGPLGP